VRLLLDADLSGRRLARRLREDGHGVLALSERLDLEGLVDPEVLALAALDGRILVTRNGRDFAPLLRT
jgi:predicted nuclease of predicted toxin-antitoxin system